MGGRITRVRWWGVLIWAVTIGFIVACLSAAAPTLQSPAGPFVCGSGIFVAGSSSHPVHDSDGDGTGYDVDSNCVSKVDGHVEHLSGIKIIGVLWLEYGVFVGLVTGLFVALVRAGRRPQRAHPFGGSPPVIS
ncbi:MAG: hypothetical protein JWL72_4896 [Ilumatobacteraceae bacterium]|nr:hypothetical protein [Ilumatobacteraceae bacterium]MCU1391558.1 hypothetical protein [Ilumatobacteraceae bacterium]